MWGTESGSQGGFLAGDDEQMHDDGEACPVRKQSPRFIEEHRAGQTAYRPEIHGIARQLIRATFDQAPRRNKPRRSAASDHNESGDTSKR